MNRYLVIKTLLIILFIFFFLIVITGRKSWHFVNFTNTMLFSPNGEMLAIALGEAISDSQFETEIPPHVEIRRVKDGSIIQNFNFNIQNFNFNVRSLAFSLDNSLIAAGVSEEQIKIWRIDDGKLLYSFKISKTNSPWSSVDFLAFGSENNILITKTGGYSYPLYQVTAWNLDNQKKLYTLPGVYNCAAVSSDGKLLALAGEKEPLTLYQLKDGTPLQQIKTTPVFCNHLEFSGDGQSLMFDGISNIEIYNVRDKKLISQIPVRNLLSSQEGTGDAVFSLDSRYVATGHFVLYETGSFDIIELPSRRLAFAGYIRFWDAKTGKIIKKVIGDKDAVGTLAFSPDGKWLASTGGDGKVRFWRMPPRQYPWLWLLSASGLATLGYWQRAYLMRWLTW